MTKTLADMTAEERAECVGMWCSIAGAGRLCVLLSTENDVANLGFSCDNEFTILSLRYKNVTPRFDLPRVWTPDGEPELAQALAEEEYQYGVTYIGVKHGGHHVEWVEPSGDAEFDKETLQLLVKLWKGEGQSPKIVRRRVSPPEVVNE